MVVDIMVVDIMVVDIMVVDIMVVDIMVVDIMAVDIMAVDMYSLASAIGLGIILPTTLPIPTLRWRQSPPRRQYTSSGRTSKRHNQLIGTIAPLPKATIPMWRNARTPGNASGRSSRDCASQTHGGIPCRPGSAERMCYGADRSHRTGVTRHW